MEKIIVDGKEIAVMGIDDNDFISLIDMAKI